MPPDALFIYSRYRHSIQFYIIHATTTHVIHTAYDGINCVVCRRARHHIAYTLHLFVCKLVIPHAVLSCTQHTAAAATAGTQHNNQAKTQIVSVSFRPLQSSVGVSDYSGSRLMRNIESNKKRAANSMN